MLTDNKIHDIAAGFYLPDERDLFARAIEAEVRAEAQEPVYAYRRKGLEYFCTCDEARYNELAQKPNLFEVTTFYTAPQPPAPCQGVTDTEYYRAEFEKLQAKVAILDGLSQDAIDGGWTYRGMDAYAKGLEAKVAEQAAEIERLNRGMTVYTEAFEAECRTTDEQSALIEQLGGAITRQHDSGEQLATRVMEQAALIAEYEAALSNITQYVASNGDTWPADMAFAAIAAHKKGIAQ